MSDAGCPRFKQNAWKKDLCSNCYRPKEEHKAKDEPKPNPLLYLPLKPAAHGILSAGNNNQRKKKSVRFTKEETEVIGYGGADSDESDDDDDDVANFGFEDADSAGPLEREVIGEEEKALERLTKTNTDFNSVLDNLNGTTAEPRLPLQLGKPQNKPIQVVIQPFSSSNSSIAASRKTHLNKLLEGEDSKPVILTSGIGQDGVKPEASPPMPTMKTIVVETKKEERGNPEGRKTHITRGTVITKSHEQAKNKLYVHNAQNKEKRNSFIDKIGKNDEVKKTIIITNGVDADDEKNKENSADAINDTLVTAAATTVVECGGKLSGGVIVEPTKVKIDSGDGEVTVKVLKLLNGQNGPAESREMAGEPDGKADSDEHETPLTPPPRNSFLHRESSPSVTTTIPAVKLTRESTLVNTPSEAKSTKITTSTIPSTKTSSPPPVPSISPPIHHPPSVSPPALPTTPPPQHLPSSPLTFTIATTPVSDESTTTATCAGGATPLLLVDSIKNKRQAPKPPVEHSTPSSTHEPLPRLRGSTDLSVDKKRTKVKQTLKKLLRLGSRDEDSYKPEEDHNSHHHHHPPTAPRPRLQIIHPLDLNKSAVQVLPPHSFPEKSPPSDTSPTHPLNSSSRPTKPPPPPRSESLNLMQRLKSSPSSDNVYVNLGEGRTGIAPVKPQRTGSMRDKSDECSQKTKPVKACTIPNDSDHVYECVEVNTSGKSSLDSSSSGNSSPDSNPSDLYYPYVVFQNGECKTIMKKRGVVHSTLEENYGAVVVANLEALTQLLKIVNERKSEIPAAVKNSSKLAWDIFEVNMTQTAAQVGSMKLYDASLKNTDVTLAVSKDETPVPEEMEPWGRFTCVPPNSGGTTCYATVLKRMEVETYSSYAKTQEKTVEGVREGVALLLRIVKFLAKHKNNVDPDSFAVMKTDGSLPPKCCYLTSSSTEAKLSPQNTINRFIAELLDTLPFARVLAKCPSKELPGVLEAWLWGPGSYLPVAAVKRWLDLERANVLQSLVCAQHRYLDPDWLSFLVHSDAPSIASSLHFIYQSSQL